MLSRFVLATALAAGLASSAMAQTPARPTAPPLGGPAVPGVCLLSREAIFANAKVGLAATARLKDLTDKAQAEVNDARKPIDTDVAAYRQQAATMTPEQRQAQEQALAARLQPVQARAALLGSEIDATRAKALQRISDEAQPVIASVYKAKGCGLLVDRNTVLGGNLVNDLTAGVVAGLDAKISTITFELEAAPAPASLAAAR